MIGKTVSHYEILEKLGEGGMGVVYKAHDTKLDRDVALKFLPLSLTLSSEDIKRFELEAKAISALNHPNIATIHDVDEVRGQKYIVLEYIPGGTLKSKLKQLKSEDREFPVSEVVDYGIQIAEALAHAHRHQIIHRDVKTDNLMLTEEGKIKLTDFGLAKLRGGVQITKTGSTIGTVAYMSPEQLRGEEVDHRSDIFSMGVVLYELFAMHLPFRGEFDAAVSYSILNENPPSVKSLRKNLPSGLEDIINRCLEKDKTKRFQRAENIVVELKKLHQEPTGSAGKTTILSKVWWIAVLSVVTVVAVRVYFFNTNTIPPFIHKKTIAVLPFKNMSDNKEDEYFSDGLTEDIITQLSKISGIEKVIARTSVMQYKGGDKSIREIGKELDVAAVLEGSVRRSGNQVRIVAQLIDATTEGHIWAETYDKEMAQIFAIQSDVAQQIASVLKAKLLPSEKEIIEKRPTENLTAYNYYLKGREYYERYQKDENETAVGLFKKSLELDTNYALAFAGLADAYTQRTENFHMGDNWLDSSMAMAETGILKDSGSAEAYKALGLVFEAKEFYHKALEANRKALELKPNYYPAMANIGDELMFLGNYVEGMKWRRKALKLSPTVAFGYAQIAMYYNWLTDDINADTYFRRALELQPNLSLAFVRMFTWHIDLGQYEEASHDNEKIFSLDQDTSMYHNRTYQISLRKGNFAQARQIAEIFASRGDSVRLAYFYWKDGKNEKARKILNAQIDLVRKQIERGSEYPYLKYYICSLYAMQDDVVEALRWFRKAFEDGWRRYRLAMYDPAVLSIRDKEEFKKIIAEMKSNVDEQKRRVQEMEKEGNQ